MDDILTKPKVHRGPVNLDVLSFSDPKILFKKLISVIEELKINIDKVEDYYIKCKYKNMKFMMEVNSVESFENLFLIKFYKNNPETKLYFKLCSKIFKKLEL